MKVKNVIVWLILPYYHVTFSFSDSLPITLHQKSLKNN